MSECRSVQADRTASYSYDPKPLRLKEKLTVQWDIVDPQMKTLLQTLKQSKEATDKVLSSLDPATRSIVELLLQEL